MAFRILIDHRKVGALNLFSDTANRSDTVSAERAIILAAFASVALNAATGGENVDTLRHGLEINREIGRAVGMLMLLKDVTQEEGLRHAAPHVAGDEHRSRGDCPRCDRTTRQAGVG
jgi:hypothetical protein